MLFESRRVASTQWITLPNGMKFIVFFLLLLVWVSSGSPPRSRSIRSKRLLENNTTIKTDGAGANSSMSSSGTGSNEQRVAINYDHHVYSSGGPPSKGIE